ncbi:Glutathione S-transferase U17 [Sesamum alatum]|uniref:glutathione transferase n=1 Tax=Sesamum alatum TaxID=300844 RepID=A0AAE1YI22_9LAMI|nr:Glutathione S-transferase U17 [Sesamum alatum]
MATEKVKVLGFWPSPFVMRARIALNMKSVEYEFQEENVMVSKSDLLLKSNPVYKKIPVLIHADRPVCESLIIVQYVDEVWASGPAILPSDPYDRATARFWATYIDDKWFPRLFAILLSEGEEAKKAAEESGEGLVLLEEAFTKCSKGQKFFGGERISYLDIALGCFLAWTRVIEKMGNVSLIDETKTPNLFKWAHHFCADDAVKDVMPDTDKLYHFSKFLVSKVKGSAAQK